MQNKHNNVLTLGVIGRCNIDDLQQIKNTIEEIPGFRVVFWKAATHWLWLKIEDSL